MRYDSQKIHQYYKDNKHIGTFDVKNKKISNIQKQYIVGKALTGAPECGDVMKLEIKVKNNIIIDTKILIFGCGSAKASSSLIAEKLIGKTIEEAKLISNKEIASDLGLPKIKFHCSVLAEESIDLAIKDYLQQLNEKNDATYNNQSNQNTCENNNITNDNTKQNILSKLSENSQLVNKIKINIKKEASDFIEQFLINSKKKYIGIRILVDISSCGIAYKLKYVKNENEYDVNKDIIHIHKFNKKNTLKIFINKELASFVNDVTIDFKSEELKSGIIFLHPKEKSKCGCGTKIKLQK